MMNRIVMMELKEADRPVVTVTTTRDRQGWGTMGGALGTGIAQAVTAKVLGWDRL